MKILIFQDAKTENVGHGQKCRYICKSDGGCRVKFESDSAFSGKSAGSCFSDSFGGSCSGTPTKCSDCNQKVNCGGSGSKGSGSSGIRCSGGNVDFQLHKKSQRRRYPKSFNFKTSTIISKLHTQLY